MSGHNTFVQLTYDKHYYCQVDLDLNFYNCIFTW